MFVNAGQEANRDSSLDSSSYLALVDRPQSSLAPGFDSSHVGYEIGHDGRVLYLISRGLRYTQLQVGAPCIK
jgi:hypothetical protein